MSHRIAKQTLEKNRSRLAKHFSGELEWELDKDTVQRLQREIEQAETHLEEEDQDWEQGDIYE